MERNKTRGTLSIITITANKDTCIEYMMLKKHDRKEPSEYSQQGC